MDKQRHGSARVTVALAAAAIALVAALGTRLAEGTRQPAASRSLRDRRQ